MKNNKKYNIFIVVFTIYTHLIHCFNETSVFAISGSVNKSATAANYSRNLTALTTTNQSSSSKFIATTATITAADNDSETNSHEDCYDSSALLRSYNPEGPLVHCSYL